MFKKKIFIKFELSFFLKNQKKKKKKKRKKKNIKEKK